MSKKFIGSEGINKFINILSTSNIFPKESITTEEVNTLWDKCEILASESELDNWDYTLDEDNGIVVLNKYTNTTATDAIVYGAYSKDGKVYNTEVKSYLFAKNKKVEIITFKSKISCYSDSTSSMFNECSNLKEINGLENLDVSNVTDMQDMFYVCPNLKEIKGIEKWNVSNELWSMRNMFCNCSSLTSLDLTSFDFSFKPSMDSTFYDCTNLKEIKVSRKYISELYRLTSTYTNMFKNCGCSEFTYV